MPLTRDDVINHRAMMAAAKTTQAAFDAGFVAGAESAEAFYLGSFWRLLKAYFFGLRMTRTRPPEATEPTV